MIPPSVDIAVPNESSVARFSPAIISFLTFTLGAGVTPCRPPRRRLFLHAGNLLVDHGHLSDEVLADRKHTC
jgi:hypothetical protein